MTQKIRIGIIGAGTNTCHKHIPKLKQIPDVEITGVVNQSSESSERVAQQFGISTVYDNPASLIASKEIDAVVIGTWPNTHCEYTCASLEAGKHVLCEARMAMDYAEAKKMYEASQKHSNLVSQIVPSPFGLKHNFIVKDLIEKGFIGDLREYIVIGADDTFYDFSQVLHWRQDVSRSGKNILMMGILHETVHRWVPPVKQVFAQSKIFETERHDPDSPGKLDVTVPDSLQIVTQLENGARGLYHLSGIELFGPGKQIHLYGSKGTLKLIIDGGEESLYCGRPGFEEMRLVDLPVEEQGQWRVEEEFINAIRGEEKVHLTDFSTALEYMQFTEAVDLSANENKAVSLPLT